MTRTLLAITVYNGQATVPVCLRSAAALEPSSSELDVLVLDDASPAEGWSEQVQAMCAELSLAYYRTPRNLGIVRNVNLGMKWGVAQRYDYVIVANSDVIFPSNLVDSMLTKVRSDSRIGSVTAWSNNVSLYSLPNEDPDTQLGSQDTVNWLSAVLDGEFGAGVVDIPAGISFCLLVPIPVIRDVGLMDPVFGRGYCEETDWSLRSKAMGYRIVLDPSTFVYHRGRGSTVEAGMLASGHTTVPANERIIDLRYPLFRSQVEGFAASDILPTLWRNGTRRIIRDAARAFGYTLHVTWLGARPMDDNAVRCVVEPNGPSPLIEARFRGFRVPIILDDRGPGESIRAELGGDPKNINVFDRGSVRDEVIATFGLRAIDDIRSYPERV